MIKISTFPLKVLTASEPSSIMLTLKGFASSKVMTKSEVKLRLL